MVRIGLRDQRDVDLPPLQEWAQFYRRRANHAQFDLGVGGTEAAQQFRQEGNRIILRASKADGALKRFPAHVGKNFVMPGKECAGVGKKFLARGRQPYARTRSLQQGVANQLLKPLHLRAQRRLRAPNLHRSHADGAGTGNDDKVLQECQIEHGDIKIINI